MPANPATEPYNYRKDNKRRSLPHFLQEPKARDFLHYKYNISS